MPKNPVVSKNLLDDDLIADLKKGAAKEMAELNTTVNGQTRQLNTMPATPQSSANIQDGNTTPDAFVKGIGFVAEPNPMSELFSPSYHFSFYLDGETPAERDPNKVFVIAETGLTGMNIQDVTIDSVVGPNIRTKNAMSTNITIVIYEPQGAMLPDLLYQAAVRKGIHNHLKAPWFLKLKLWGYDEIGHVVEVGGGWTWQLSLIDITSKISESGAIHTITAMPLSEQALNDQYCMLAQPSKANGVTVGDALHNVVKGMNQSVIERYGVTSKPLLEFAVEDRAYGFDTKVGVKRPFDHRITNINPTTGNLATVTDYSEQTSHFGPGTDFPAIVDKLMARSDTAIMMARPSRTLPPSTGNDEEKVIRDVVSVMHYVDTHVEYLDYDYVAGDYRKKITYIVKPYSTLRLLTSMGRAKNFDKDTNFNRQKAMFAVQKSFMHKQYDYLFTGLNTEIERFDISLNFNWAVQVPMYQGQNTNTGTPAQVDLTKNVQTLQADLDAKNTSLNEAQAKLEAFNGRDANANVPLDTAFSTNQLTADSKTKQDLQNQITTLAKERDDLANLLGKKRDEFNTMMESTRKAQLARRSPITKRITDGEDLVYANAQGDKSYQGADQGGDSFLPITIVQDSNNPGLRTASGTATDNNAKKSVYGALLNQLYGTMDGNLISIDLEIRGDPYWLGPGDDGEIFDNPSSKEKPNFKNGEHIFLFRFKLPLGYNSKTGAVDVDKGLQAGTQTLADSQNGIGDNAKQVAPGVASNTFTGFYSCIEVQNRFQGGKFTQTLKAARIAGWSYENIIEGRESAVTDDTVFDNSPGPTSPPGGNGSPVKINGGARNGGATVSGNIDERTLLALTMVEEAGGEGAKGMQAVGNVIVNRASAGIRGNTVSQVIMSPKQFSAWNNQTPASSLARRQDSAIYQQAYQIAGNVLDGSAGDVTRGATSYYNPAKASPSWANSLTQTVVIGNHRFMK